MQRILFDDFYSYLRYILTLGDNFIGVIYLLKNMVLNIEGGKHYGWRKLDKVDTKPKT